MNQMNTYPWSEDDQLKARFTAYVAAALRNGKTGYLRKKERCGRELSLEGFLEHMDESALQTGPHSGDDLLDTMLEKERCLECLISSNALLAAVLSLNEKERRILNLHLLEQKKFGEIAGLLDVKKKTAEKCYERSNQENPCLPEGGFS